MIKISGIGISCIDSIFTTPRIEWGDTAIIGNYNVLPGGLIAMALIAAHRLGAASKIITLVGDDNIGNRLITEMSDLGINTESAILVFNGKTPFSFIHVDQSSGERTIFHCEGDGLIADINSLDLSSINGSTSVLIDDIYLELSHSYAQYANKHDIPVIADFIPDERNEILLAYVDYMIAPRHFMKKYNYTDYDEAFIALHKKGVKNVIITLGADGYIWSDNNNTGSGLAFEVNSVDTTGAGDVFHGAFAYGIANKWNIAKSAEFASAVAAIKCTGTGASVLPTLHQTIDFLIFHGCKEWIDEK